MKSASPLSFRALTAAQSFASLNNNLLKVLISLMAATAVVEQRGSVMDLALTVICFNVPFLLFSGFAGACADRFSKSAIVRFVRVLDVALMLLAFFFLVRADLFALLLVLFLLGMQGAVFSPAKYGLLPELLDDSQISRANGYLELWNLVGIIAGTTLGAFLAEFTGKNAYLPGMCLAGFAIAGALCAFFIEKTPAANPVRTLRTNPFEAIRFLREIKLDNGLFQTVVGISLFWALGALYQLNLPLYAKQMAGLGDAQAGMLIAVLGLGIGLGSLLAGHVSEGKVELGLVPMGAAGISLTSIVLAFCYEYFTLTLIVTLGLGLSSGFFIVPLQAFLQQRSPAEKRGSYIAAANFAAFTVMIGASFLLGLLLDLLGITPANVFFVFGMATVAVAAYICTVLPQMLVRCMNWILIHTLYRVRVVGVENIPASGGALLVCNHMSFVDPLLLLASLGRHVRFLMYRPIYEARLINPAARTMGAIPIGRSAKREDVTAPLAEARQAIQDGELVGIFAEGGISRIGQMLKFRRGLERIMDGLDAPIIPIHLDQIWGSIFSFRGGRFLWKWPRTLPYPVTITFGKPLPAQATSNEVRQAVQELGADAFQLRRDAFQVLHRGFIKSCKRAPFRTAVSDAGVKRISALGLLASVLAFADWMKQQPDKGDMTGVVLPPSAAGVIANCGLLIAGKVPVNLNYTAGKDAQASAVRQCKIQTIISSRRVLEKIPLLGLSAAEAAGAELPHVLYLEDFEQTFTWPRKLYYAAAALVLPCFAIERLFFVRKFSRDDIATVIFSSGSTGEPKGVLLSHANISANIKSIYEIYQFKADDCVAGVLPFFHSFGFTGTLWLPLLGGFRAAYHHNPLDAAAVGRLVEEHQATMLMSTPTFLLGYIRRCGPEQFKSLRYVMTGAEKLKERIAESFVEKFGIVPREGYGCTELSPLAIANIEGYSGKDTSGRDNVQQVGQKLGTVGHPIPGVAVRIVDPDRFSPLPVGAEGLLLVRGANVMRGYLGHPERTKEVMRDGWYVTGDIARIDEDGFVTITDRLSRFSKIAGEMVPHVRIEEAIHKALGEHDNAHVVTAVADEKRGEKLVVLSTKDVDPRELNKKLVELGLPNLWIPAPDNYYRIEAIPLLGSGKLDLSAVKALAQEKARS